MDYFDNDNQRFDNDNQRFDNDFDFILPSMALALRVYLF